MSLLNNYQKIGIMGGTFDPIHNGHIQMAKFAKVFAGLDKILFIPTGKSYMKQSTTDAQTRYEMVQSAIQSESDFLVSDMEIQRSGNTYTYETLEILKSKYPHITFYLIMGADCLFSIEKWYQCEKIFQNCILLVTSRGDLEPSRLVDKILDLKECFHADIELLDEKPVDISSTEIRQMVSKNRSIEQYVPNEVNQFIIKHGLYGREQ